MYNVVGVVFGNAKKIYYFSATNPDIVRGSSVIVETEKGLQFGVVEKIFSNSSIQKFSDNNIKSVIRIATSEDIKRKNKNVIDASSAVLTAKKLVNDLGLNMRVLDANYTLDRNQLIFNFVSEERVDFRELARELAKIFRTRIELRQIGVRDKASMVGGLGPCGGLLCCNLFLNDINSVTINMAKNQFLALNPSKINGSCGRLLCCLGYEDDLYTDLKSKVPSVGTVIKNSDYSGTVVANNIFSLTYDIEKQNGDIVTVSVGDKK